MPSNRKKKLRAWIKTVGCRAICPCHWCDQPLFFDEATFDHEPPIAESGTRSGPGVIACKACNHQRGQETSSRIQAGRYQRAVFKWYSG